MQYPSCIYLGEQLPNNRRACLCPDLIAKNGVSAGFCNKCRYRVADASVPPVAVGASAPVQLPCVHLGADTGETVTCASCTTTDAPVLECSVYGKCLATNSASGYVTCTLCREREASTGDKPRVFLAGYPSDIGGANAEAWHLIRLWRKLGIEVHLIPTWQPDYRYFARLQALGCCTHKVTPQTLADVPGLAGATVVSLCNGGFMEHLDKFKALGCRTIWLNCMTQLFDWEVRAYEKHGLPDVFIFQSEYQRQALEPQLVRFAYKLEQGRLIRSAFIPEEFPFKPLAHAPGEPFVVGKLARPDPEKWPAMLWQSLAAISNRRALVMGVDDKIATKIGTTPEWAEVLKPGAMPAKDFYARLHCLIPLSGGAKENWPRIGLEAMAAGVPIVAPNEGGWREMIVNGVNGILTKLPHEFALFASELAENEPLRMKIANVAREHLAELTKGVGEAWQRLLAKKTPYGLKELPVVKESLTAPTPNVFALTPETSPEITVVMPVFNGMPYLPQAIESILGQTFRDFELICADDGSTDASLQTLRAYQARDSRIKVVAKKNGGTGSALNVGFAQARGRYQTWWSADSWVQPTFLADLRQCLEGNPNTVMAYSDFRIFDQESKVMSKPIPANANKLNLENAIGPCWLWRRETKEKAGAFDLRLAEDWDMHQRLAKVGPLVHCPKMLGTWRGHKDCLTKAVERNKKPWKLERIPQVAHFYWGNKTLSFLRWMSIVSFRKLNPDWHIKVHVPQHLYSGSLTWQTHEHKATGQAIHGSDHTANLMASGVEIVQHDFNTYGFRDDVPENYKSDFLRWVLLAGEGGLWCDFDIVFTRPMKDLPTNTVKNYNARIGLCQYEDDTHAIGLLYGAANNDFFSLIRDKAKAGLNLSNYQSIGNFLLEDWRDISRIEREFGVVVDSIPKNAVYLFDWKNTRKIFLENNAFNLPGVIGIHWYAGDQLAQEWEEKITANNFRTFNNTISQAIKVTYP